MDLESIGRVLRKLHGNKYSNAHEEKKTAKSLREMRFHDKTIA